MLGKHYEIMASAIILKTDLTELDKSCNGKDKQFAREIFGKLVKEFTETYGKRKLEEGYIVTPAVFIGEQTGILVLGLTVVDLTEKELYDTVFFTPYGIRWTQGTEDSHEVSVYVRENLEKFESWTFEKVESIIGMHHTVPENIKGIVGDYLKSVMIGV